MKTCSTCKQDKPRTEFHRENRTKDGLRSMCKPCSCAYAKSWVKRNPERKSENNSKWYAANPEKVAESNRKWYAANPEKRAEYARKWALRWPEKVAAKEAVTRAVIEGRMLTPTNCEECNAATPLLDFHHAFGYAPENWLRGVWLCYTCHGATRRKYNRPVFQFELRLGIAAA